MKKGFCAGAIGPAKLSFIIAKFQCSKFLKYSKLNFLQVHGAIFFAISAASIAIVHDQQKGSISGVLNFHHERINNATARFSLRGASQTSFLYHL